MLALLNKYHKGQKERMLIFGLYKKETERVATMLQRKGYDCKAINGDLSQDKRTQVLEDFKSGKLPCMVATGESICRSAHSCLLRIVSCSAVRIAAE